MGRIVLASNRVVDLSKAAQAGGVAIAIADLLRTRPGLWLGWCCCKQKQNTLGPKAKVARMREFA
ncbi:hypothetical protein LCGC14_2156870, partial [marine sediment metagenome]